MYLVATYSGYDRESKLREHIEKIDLTPYERKENNSGEVILVLTEDFIKQLEGGRRK